MPTFNPEPQQEWRNWEPQNLLDEHSSPEQEMMESLPVDLQSDEQLQAELARLRQQAEQKGFAQGQTRGIEEGKKQGYDAGFSQGQQEGIERGMAQSLAQQRETTERFARLCDEFKIALDNLDSVIPSRLVQLALTAARAMLGKSVAYDNEILLEKVQMLLQKESLFKEQTQLWVNVDDVTLVQEQVGKSLASLGWELRGDTNILPGGCRITSSEGELDATITTGWQELCHLGREDYPA